jgi:uncharacterized protein YggE
MRNLFLATLLGMCCTAVWASDPPPEKAPPPDKASSDQTITAVGSGMAYARPDTAEISLEVVTEAASAAAARTDNTTVTDRLIRRLDDLGVPRRDVESCPSAVVPQRTQAVPGGQAEVVGYKLTNDVRVTVRNLDRLDKILDDLTSQGPGMVQEIRYLVDNPKGPWAEASRKAIAEARRKAEQLAREAGMELGDVISIEEQRPSNPSSNGKDRKRSSDSDYGSDRKRPNDRDYSSDRKRQSDDSYTYSSADKQECRVTVAVTFAARPIGTRTLEGKSRPNP